MRRGGFSMCRMRFTLIEMLTVVGIIAVLVSILAPTLSKARQRAAQIQCMSNLRELASAMTLYSDEWRGRLPPYVTKALPLEHPGLNWPGWSYPYYGSTRLLICPSSMAKEPDALRMDFAPTMVPTHGTTMAPRATVVLSLQSASHPASTFSATQGIRASFTVKTPGKT